MKVSKALKWDELATEYDKQNNGRPARTLPMDSVFEWAEGRKEFHVDEKEGTIHKVLGR